MQHVPFFQKAPHLGNQYKDDDVLQRVLDLYLSKTTLQSVDSDLCRLGDRVIGRPMLDACADAESHLPYVDDYDSFGNRVSRLRTSAGWKAMKEIAAEEGIVATAFERQYGAESRIVQFAKYYLYNPSSATFGCPLAMTDGAARLFELVGGFEDYKSKLLSRHNMATSGQWMTERGGGSDLANSETVAIKSGDGYILHGFKWFSSATDADMALSLARTEKGLSLFLIDVKLAGPKIKIVRLKKKLGTHPLPTAELELQDVPGILIGSEGKGVKTISTILNITRIYTAVGALSSLRRAYAVAVAYADVRMVGTKLLSEKPLHVNLLTRIRTVLTGVSFLTFYVVSILGKDECDSCSPEEKYILRGLVPVVKAYVSKLCHLEIGECCEALGGLGYIENVDIEFNLARIFRDSLVMCIWEGTTNVLALDFARALKDDKVKSALCARFGKDASLIICDMTKEANYKEQMFAFAHNVTHTLLVEAAELLRDKQLSETAQTWARLQLGGHTMSYSKL